MSRGRLGDYAASIRYLQRAELDDQGLRLLDDEVEAALRTAVDLETPLHHAIWLAEVRGVSRFWQTGRPEEQGGFYFTKDILAGLNGQHIPIYFLIRGESKRVHLYVGTMADEQGSGPAIRAVFNSQYPGVQMWPEKELANIQDQKEKRETQERMQKELKDIRTFIEKCNHLGVVTGVPSPDVRGREDTGTQIDRLIRGLYGEEWAFLVLAEPEADTDLVEMQLAFLNEQIRVEQEEGIRESQESRRQTIAAYYYQLLQTWYDFLEACQFEGGWRVQSYICAPDSATYQRGKALIKGIFSGKSSRVDRIRVLDCPGAGRKTASFSPIVVERPKAPSPELSSGKTKSFKYHTVVSSGQLSALIHLPRAEVPGYFVRESATFDVSSHVPADEQVVAVGEILDRGRTTGNSYRVRLEDLTKHCLLVGITGSGKTNTTFHLLKQLQQRDAQIPFLVIEPAKREYRRLAELLPPGRQLRVFTVGEEGEDAAPFRLNPFEIRHDVNVQTHIDLLKSVFNASFGMWTPLPQVLERAIHEIYRDKGWDPVHSTNDRAAIEGPEGRSWHPRAQPTLTDLYLKVAEMVPKLGYDEEVTRNVSTALETRINSLRMGRKGLMLDTSLSIPIETLLDEPTVLELEGVGDDDEKAFIMGLMLIMLYEYYRTQKRPTDSGPQHITVIEEAHRLLTNVPVSTDPEATNLRGKAVETFVNMLSEVRAYGEGFFIAEQIPTKLAPDVVKNTALKVMHRIVANDDRVVMGGAMNLNEPQVRQVVALGTGEAVVHSGGRYGDDNAMLIKVPYAKGDEKRAPIGIDIRKSWVRFRDHYDLATIFLAYPTCKQHCGEGNPRCADARMIAEDPAVAEGFAAFILSLVSSREENDLPKLMRELYPTVHSAMLPHMTGSQDNYAQTRCVLTHALYRYMEKRGAQYGWKYEDITSMTNRLLPALLSTATGEPVTHDAAQELVTFAHNYRQQCQRVGPFYGCRQVCQGTCFYRYGVEPLVMKTELRETFRAAAKEADLGSTDSMDTLCEFVSGQILLPVVEDVFRRRVALCFVIQQAAAWRDYGWHRQRSLVDDVIAYYKSEND